MTSNIFLQHVRTFSVLPYCFQMHFCRFMFQKSRWRLGHRFKVQTPLSGKTSGQIYKKKTGKKQERENEKGKNIKM